MPFDSVRAVHPAGDDLNTISQPVIVAVRQSLDQDDTNAALTVVVSGIIVIVIVGILGAILAGLGAALALGIFYGDFITSGGVG